MTLEKSTTVRTSTPRTALSPAFRTLLATTRTLDRVAPEQAARIAEHLWFRLPEKPAPSYRERFTPAHGRRFRVRHDHVDVSGMIYGPDDAPTAYLVHGWGGWWQQLAAYVPALVDAGYRVVAYDSPSHGASAPGQHGGRSTTLMEMGDAFAVVAWQQGPADLVVAHSLGAMATMWAWTGGTRAKAYAFLAPGVRVAPMVGAFGQMLGLSHGTTGRLARRLDRRIGYPAAHFDLDRIAHEVNAQAPGTRLLVAHDRDDRETPADGAVLLTDAWAGSDLVLTSGLGHRRVIWDEGVVRRVVQLASATRG
ncbi:alpha/beta fold hydrolase [Luteipulveratus mongoliensis]|uniref:Serine aminopeptidase S33 domain-containing protein n=1 Tax=Luteipulveratus mongoliensis TaxID=571913 RepID=A0A0K1JLT9_9MICO|nr:alpha/beta hydrolase [Luteipulveratus mongoliensis]AKU17676.1 hypothetical protein VV02_20545 [Luteipulveratus mongoliensis]